MSAGFVKLYGSILDSSIWFEDDATRLVWITMLAMADATGVVEASILGVANRARVPVEACERALERLQSPDPYSRTPDHEGRRVEAVEGGWRLLNAARYRERRGASAERMAAMRDRKRRNGANTRPSQCDDVTAEAEAEEEAKRSIGERGSPSTAHSRGTAQSDAGASATVAVQATLIPGVEDGRTWRRRQARRLWDWHEAERVAVLHEGRGEIRHALDEHLALVLRLVRKVATQEGIDERKAFERVRDFRRLAIAQAAEVRKAGTDPTYADKLVRWSRSDSAWSIKAYDAVRGQAVELVDATEPTWEQFRREHDPTREELKRADEVFDATGSRRIAFETVLRERTERKGKR